MAQDTTILTELLSLLDNCELSATEISERTGVGYKHLKGIKNRKVPNPGIKTVDKLLAYLRPYSQIELLNRAIQPKKASQ